MISDLKIYDIESLKRRLLDDDELVQIVLSAFYKDLSGQYTLFCDALEGADSVKVAAQAHKIKGAAANVGAEFLSYEMQVMEESALRGDFQKLVEGKAVIDEHLPLLLHEVRLHLE